MFRAGGTDVSLSSSPAAEAWARSRLECCERSSKTGSAPISSSAPRWVRSTRPGSPAGQALLASCAIPGVFPPVTIGRREYVDGGVANHTPITVAIELGADEIYVLPVGYPWLNREPTNALGMALHALARIVEQKLDA